MNRKLSMLMSLGISAALIAGTIWFMYHQHNRFGYSDGRWGMPHHMMIGGGGMGIIMILFWVAVIAAIAIAISGGVSGRSSIGNSQSPPQLPDALDILKRRYAAGEIDKTQYDAMKQDLER